MYNERRVKKSELLQLILLDNLYALSGSERIFFQGGTALRWVYGGMRFSEDLDFVSDLPVKGLSKIMDKMFQVAQTSCIAQFGPGRLEIQQKGKREEALRSLFVFRRDTERERIAVRLEIETLKRGYQPLFEKFILRDLPMVSAFITSGDLIMPYSSSIILAESAEEILSDKIRALYERDYIKGRDIYDIWWLNTQFSLKPKWSRIKSKFIMYQAPFNLARDPEYFLKKKNEPKIIEALQSDLPRFLPQSVFSLYLDNYFKDFISAVKEVVTDLLHQGMKSFFEEL